MRSVEGIIFDFDGTLFDSQYIWESIDSDYLKSIGKVPKSGLKDEVSSFTLRQGAEFLKKEYSIKLSVDEIITGIKQRVADEYIYRVQPKDGAAEAVAQAHELGIKMCVASTNTAELIKAAAKRCGLDKYFCGYISGSDLNINKSTPRIYEIACKQLGTQKENTWVFEDMLFGVTSAKKGGFKAAAVYDEYSNQSRVEMEAVADVYLDSMRDWKKIYD